ncbi:MAG: TolC family protein [Pseudobdellovibrionaceae bacterium]
MRIFYRILWSFVACTSPALAHALSLDEAIHSATQESHELKQIQLTTEVARLAEQKAFAGYLPRLDLTGRHLLSEKFEVLEFEFAGANFAMPAIQPYTSLSLTASLDLFTGMETTNQLHAAQLAHESSLHVLKRAEERLRVQVRTLFYRALGSQILVEVSEQNIKTLEGHLRDVNARVRSGVSTRFDVLRTEVQLEDAQTEKVGAESNVAVARARLFEAIGIPDDQRPLEGVMPGDFSKMDPAKVQITSVQREDRVALIQDLESHEKLSRAAASHWLPRVSIFGSQEWYNNSNHSIWEPDERFKNAYALGVQFKWNLFDGGASTASQRQAEISERVTAEKLAQLNQSLPADLEEAKRRLIYNITSYKAKLRSIQKAEEALRLAQGGVRAGTRTNTEVLDAAVDLNRAKAAAVKSQVDAEEALGQVELALGHSI